MPYVVDEETLMLNQKFWRNVLERNSSYELKLSDVANVHHITKKQHVEYRSNLIYIYYTLTAHLIDGSKKDLREVGPYKAIRYVPSWQGENPYYDENNVKEARINAKLEAEADIESFMYFKMNLNS